MKIFHNKIFAPVLLSVIKGPLDYIQRKNDRGENSFHTEKRKNFQILWHWLLRLL